MRQNILTADESEKEREALQSLAKLPDEQKTYIRDFLLYEGGVRRLDVDNLFIHRVLSDRIGRFFLVYPGAAGARKELLRYLQEKGVL